jgi:hypothetical protein
MQRVILSAVVAVGTTVMAAPAAGFEVVLGLGADDVSRGDGVATSGFVELRTATLLRLGPVDVGIVGVVEGDVDGDLFAGAGPFAIWAPFGEGLRLEGGVSFGGYREGDSGTDLGSGYAFRSAIGASYPLGARLRLGIAFNHKSNAGFADANPGVESAYVTLGYAF